MLAYGEHTGQDLTRMQEIGESVYQRDGSVLRQLLDFGVSERPDHDSIDIPREHARSVGNWFTSSELNIARREKQGMPAELPRADFEGHTGTRRRLHEDHRQRLSGERLPGVLAAPHALRQVEEIEQLFTGVVG